MLTGTSWDSERGHLRKRFRLPRASPPTAVRRLMSFLRGIKFIVIERRSTRLAILPLLMILNCIPFSIVVPRLSIPFCCCLWCVGGDRWWLPFSTLGDSGRSIDLAVTLVGVTCELLLLLMWWWLLLLLREVFRFRSLLVRTKPRFAGGTW